MHSTKKVLLVTTVSGFVPQFEMNNVRLLQSMGFEVHYAANYHTPSYGTDNHRLDHTGIVRHQIDFVRSPFKPENIQVYRQLKTLMKEQHFQLVHCHTPMGGVMARLAAHATKTGPVVYTAHGFHFFKGAPVINWLLYYPMERFLSRFTTQQICINQEDYERAEKKFHAKYVDYIPGVGIDLSRFQAKTAEEIAEKKWELGLSEKKLILLSSGELIHRKNHETIIRAAARLKESFPDFQYVICGHGVLEDQLRGLAKELKVEEEVRFLGYREDMLDIYGIADIFLFPSYQEGLPMALLEAMASGLPVICSDIRGSRDLMEPEREAEQVLCKGGIMIKKADDVDAYVQALRQLAANPQKLVLMGQANASRAAQFGSERVRETMKMIYERLTEE